MRIPSKQDREQLERYRNGLGNLMTDLTDQAQAWADSGLKMEHEQRSVRVRRRNTIRFDSAASDEATPAADMLAPTNHPYARLLKLASTHPAENRKRLRA